MNTVVIISGVDAGKVMEIVRAIAGVEAEVQPAKKAGYAPQGPRRGRPPRKEGIDARELFHDLDGEGVI